MGVCNNPGSADADIKLLLVICTAGIQDVASKEPEAVAAYMASYGSAAAAAQAAGARR
jgi:hypothetical protein